MAHSSATLITTFLLLVAASAATPNNLVAITCQTISKQSNNTITPAYCISALSPYKPKHITSLRQLALHSLKLSLYNVISITRYIHATLLDKEVKMGGNTREALMSCLGFYKDARWLLNEAVVEAKVRKYEAALGHVKVALAFPGACEKVAARMDSKQKRWLEKNSRVFVRVGEVAVGLIKLVKKIVN